MVNLKQCAKCFRKLAPKKFKSDRQKADGKCSYCSDCMKFQDWMLRWESRQAKPDLPGMRQAVREAIGVQRWADYDRDLP